MRLRELLLGVMLAVMVAYTAIYAASNAQLQEQCPSEAQLEWQGMPMTDLDNQFPNKPADVWRYKF